MKEKNKKGFTLLEMLVVVLIIGILAAVALPQYQIAVEKSKSAEVLTNLATIKREIQYYITAKGLPDEGICYKDFATVELSGGKWDYTTYLTKFFAYNVYITREGGSMEILRMNETEDYMYNLYCTQFGDEFYNDDTPMPDGWYCSCVTESTDFGRKMCKRIYEPLGFKYVDGDL